MDSSNVLALPVGDEAPDSKSEEVEMASVFDSKSSEVDELVSSPGGVSDWNVVTGSSSLDAVSLNSVDVDEDGTSTGLVSDSTSDEAASVVRSKLKLAVALEKVVDSSSVKVGRIGRAEPPKSPEETPLSVDESVVVSTSSVVNCSVTIPVDELISALEVAPSISEVAETTLDVSESDSIALERLVVKSVSVSSERMLDSSPELVSRISEVEDASLSDSALSVSAVVRTTSIEVLMVSIIVLLSPPASGGPSDVPLAEVSGVPDSTGNEVGTIWVEPSGEVDETSALSPVVSVEKDTELESDSGSEVGSSEVSSDVAVSVDEAVKNGASDVVGSVSSVGSTSSSVIVDGEGCDDES